jgi:hypothetical protein
LTYKLLFEKGDCQYFSDFHTAKLRQLRELGVDKTTFKVDNICKKRVHKASTTKKIAKKFASTKRIGNFGENTHLP